VRSSPAPFRRSCAAHHRRTATSMLYAAKSCSYCRMMLPSEFFKMRNRSSTLSEWQTTRTGQTANKFRLKAKLNKNRESVNGRAPLPSFPAVVLSPQIRSWLPAKRCWMIFSRPPKRAAHDEKNVLRVDCGRGFLASLREIHHCLDLAGNIVRRTGRNFCLLHQLQEIRLDPSTPKRPDRKHYLRAAILSISSI